MYSQKTQLIDSIRHHNPSADRRFLEQFDEGQLADYLSHIESAKRREVRIARPRKAA
jgi:hypothetical protein